MTSDAKLRSWPGRRRFRATSAPDPVDRTASPLHDADWLGQNGREPSKYVLELLALRPEQRADQDLQPPSDVLRPILSEPYIDCRVGYLSS
jgi:hypothetical protein